MNFSISPSFALTPLLIESGLSSSDYARPPSIRLPLDSSSNASASSLLNPSADLPDGAPASTYFCDVCQMQFSQKANMLRHRIRHTGTKPFQCTVCYKRFFRKDHMREHMLVHVKQDDRFECPVCDTFYAAHAELRAHVNETHGKTGCPKDCKGCKSVFVSAQRLIVHFQTKHMFAKAGIVYKDGEDDEDLDSDLKPAPGASNCSLLSTSNNPLSPPPSSSAAYPVQIAPANSNFGGAFSADAQRESPDEEQNATPGGATTTTTGTDASGSPNLMDDEENGSELGEGDEATPPAAPSKNVKRARNLWRPTPYTASKFPSKNFFRESIPPGLVDEKADATAAFALLARAASSTLHCVHCGIVFFDQTLYFLHKGVHSESDPWKCNLCGRACGDRYEFHAHLISAAHC